MVMYDVTIKFRGKRIVSRKSPFYKKSDAKKYIKKIKKRYGKGLNPRIKERG